MKKFQKFKKKVVNYLFDHYKTRTALSYLRTLLFCVVSGVLYGIGYSCFVLPPSDSYSIAIATGGVSGLSQNFVLIFVKFV